LVQQNPQKYVKGEIIVWYGCTSTTTSLETVQSFLDARGGSGTIFCINECFSGRSISHMSSVPVESEVLIPPASRFQILAIVSFGNIPFIQLKQIKSLEDKFLKFESE